LIPFGRVLVEPEPEPGRTAAGLVARDDDLAAEVGAGVAPPTARVWRNHQAVVMPHWRLRTVEEREVVDRHGAGWPLCGRSSGGGVVVHDGGTLNLSLVFPLRSLGEPSIEAAYALWFDVVGETLRDAYDVIVSPAEVADAFCKGRWDAAVAGRKLAGTAQARRRGAVVVHGTILVDVDAAEYVSLVARAEAAAGIAGRSSAYDPSTVVSLAELTGSKLTPRAVAATLAARLRA
jgi:lipoate-protein ligase A